MTILFPAIRDPARPVARRLTLAALLAAGALAALPPPAAAGALALPRARALPGLAPLAAAWRDAGDATRPGGGWNGISPSPGPGPEPSTGAPGRGGTGDGDRPDGDSLMPSTRVGPRPVPGGGPAVPAFRGVDGDNGAAPAAEALPPGATPVRTAPQPCALLPGQRLPVCR